MRILYIIHSLNVGGSETLVTNYLIRLKQRGEDVALIQFDDGASFLNDCLKKNGIPIFTVFPKQRSTNYVGKVWNALNRKMTLIWKINEIIHDYYPDIIHFHTNLTRMDKLDVNYNRCFFSFHTTVSRSIGYPSKLFRKSLVATCKKGLTTVALSKSMKMDIETELGNVKNVIVPNGINIEDIRSHAVSRTDFCRQFSISEKSFILGHVGRYHPVKNHEKVIDIFREVKKRQENAYLVLIGGADTRRQREIDERIEKYHLTDSVIQLGERKDAQGLMASFDCMVLPSLTEGFSLVIAECQAHGVRCIATDVVPDEVIVNDNAFKLSIEKSDAIWADYVLGDFVENRGKDIMDLDISRSIEKCLQAYEEAMDEKKV